MDPETTITAIATPPGNGAIAVIRVSGKDTFPICEKLFFPAAKGLKLSKQSPNTIHFGKIEDNGTIIDEVLLSLFRSPHSYTGDDVIEISCHGSPFIQQRILQLLIRSGAVQAGPGEFTQRAFLNGKMDLSRAEAVADLIASESEAFHRVAINQMRGGISNEIKKLRESLLHFISLVELELDFSEEDVEFANREELRHLLNNISSRLDGLTGSFALGNALKQGIPVVIIGKPNAGKSTLLNLLLNEERAIVSDIPGTTRDSIEDVIHLEGIEFRFIDTAGIRETTDTVEILGIARTMEKVKQASVILLLAEATDTGEHIRHLLKSIRNKPEMERKSIILLLNKSDLLTEGHLTDLKEINDHYLEISAKKGTGLEELKKLLVSIVSKTGAGDADVIVTNIRHYQALSKARESAERALSVLDNNLTGDLLALDIREILHYLGEITGEITTDEILGNIFKNFCIGK